MTKTLEQLDPTTLVLGTNVRADTKLEAPFLASVKERGVLEPVLAHRDADGQVVVDQGQRRTLAAAQLGLLSIPVVVDGQAPKDADRLVDQWVENEHRASLSNRERIQAIEQMALVGLSPGQIAKRAAISKADVASARAAAASQTAVDHADELTLEDAALLAEFEDDAKAVAELLAAADRGYPLASVVERIREDREDMRALTAAAAALAEQGLEVIEPPVTAYSDRTTRSLSNLRHPGGTEIDPASHVADCAGHVVWVTHSWRGGKQEIVTVEGCTGWESHGHIDPYGYSSTAPTKKAAADMDEAEREKARAERKHVIESTKDWKAATTVRRRWLAEFGRRKTAPDGAEALVAAAVAGGWPTDVSPYSGASVALGLLGTTKEALGGELATASPKRALQIALAVIVASWEAGTVDDQWRAAGNAQQTTVRVLEAISQWGHQLSEIEERIVAGTAATAVAA